MTTTFETAKVGDRVWSIRSGWGKISGIDDTADYPLTIKYDSIGYDTFTFEGYSLKTHAVQSLFWDEVVIEAPEKPMPNLKVDTKVLVWSRDGEEKKKRYFSHFENGIIRTFHNGWTSWTSENSHTSKWDYWELAE